jgi:hypothetical protein
VERKSRKGKKGGKSGGGGGKGCEEDGMKRGVKQAGHGNASKT